VTVSGDGYIDDPEIVDTFVTLFEANDARQAVQHGDDIRDVLMRPVDTGEIKRELREKTSERDQLERDLNDLESRIENEPALTERRESIKTELDEITEEIEELESVVSDHEADVDMAEEAEGLVDDLDAKRSEVRDLENEVEVLEAELDALEDEQAELREQAVDLYRTIDDTGDAAEIEFNTGDGDLNIPWDEVTDETRIRELEDTVTELRARKNELSATIDDLTRIINFNESTLDDATDLPGVTTTTTETDVTAELAPDSDRELECWTCGTTVPRNAIQSRTSELEAYVDDKQSELDSVETELQDVKSDLAGLRDTKQEREELQRELESVQEQQTRVEESIEETKTDLETAREELHELQTAVEETEELRESDLLDVYQELNEYEYRRGQLETELDDVTDELAAISDARSEKDALEADLDDIRDDIESLRTRIADLERAAVDSFNDEMETILDRLAYENIERVWIERIVPDTSSALTTGEFELHIVRTSGDGAAYEDRVENLSESEREVIGLIVAVAGYIVHDVGRIVPWILLDSVEAIDANRLVELITYITQHTTFLGVALLPEDAAAFPDDYERVTADALSTTT
jgi:DNA repair exonuclease SbcCD ATPase subunit